MCEEKYEEVINNQKSKQCNKIKMWNVFFYNEENNGISCYVFICMVMCNMYVNNEK